MMNDAAHGIVDSPEWRAAAGLPLPSQPLHDEQQKKRRHSWARAASRHAKLAGVVAGVADETTYCGVQQAHQYYPGQRLPFHPLHCAASQGMISAGRLLLQRCSSNKNQHVSRLFFVLHVCTRKKDEARVASVPFCEQPELEA